MSNDARVWDRMANRYFHKPIKDEDAYRIKLATTQEYLQAGMDILEIGCGTGATAVAHAPHVAHVTATDISARMIEFAEGRKADAGLNNLRFAQASFEATVDTEDRFDAVLMHSLLHLLENPAQSIQKAADLLRPGGMLISNTPCLKGKIGAFRPILKLGAWLGVFPAFIQEFSEQTLIEWLDAAGLKTIHHWHPDGADAVFTISRKA